MMLSIISLLCLLLCHRQQRTRVSAFSTTTSSIGERIQQSTRVSDLMRVAQDLWLPTDADLPTHLRTQAVHHEKRLRWSAQLLAKLGSLVGVHAPNDDDDDIMTMPALERAVLAAAMPFDEDRPDKEGRYLCEALVGLHNVMGYSSQQQTVVMPLTPSLQQGLQQLLQRAEAMANVLPLALVAEMRWASMGILARCNVEGWNGKTLTCMNDRVAGLPFDIAPLAIDWNLVFPDTKESATSRLQNEIPFHFDTIVTRTGTAVQERRGTAWIAQDGIGALAYSGKLMEPHAISPAIQLLMRQVEASGIAARHLIESPFFDCALCNHYPDGESSCRFHTDPEHGSHWERLTCVVAAGSPRRFAFRPIPNFSTWSDWERGSSSVLSCDPNTPAVITLFPGDVVQMWGTCNDDFHHAVYPGRPTDGNYGDRISLVLKRAIPRHGGLRGHSLAGQGRRRSRRKEETTSAETETTAPPNNNSLRPKKRRTTSNSRRR